ncbi:kinase domain protein (macronuclear) [Tetrahymena thermophila SB210]|uniref:Kinase domain protein n=1 Tax=Tetrahymena thermophila (strain SB210) TaxID=312017 RepID=Q245J6_TETTS|nr:kinase domain protein [Tetrahymena thermophila SB210]EAS03636.3 kinase domain protein [Tetrahymena thermophila SB210]|eukprot:XP_001023882.3 kinase domain protein [Tetrahymena thermophila SB210]
MGQIIHGSYQSQQIQEFCEQNSIDINIFQNQIKFLSQMKYQYVGILGNGLFGQQIQAYSENYQSVAIKIIYSKNSGLETALKQSTKYKQIKNTQHLAQIHEIVYNPSLNTYYIVQELADCSLKEILESCKLTDKQIYETTLQLLEGLAELENLGLIHGDIKTENILYNRPKNKFMFTDFGLAQVLMKSNKPASSNSKQLQRTQIYGAPELEKEQDTSRFQNKMDTYALGMVLSEIIIGKGFELEESIDIKNNNDIQDYIPFDSHHKFYIEKIILNMVKVSKKERQETSELINTLKKNFEFNEQDLMAIYIKEISKLLQNQQKISKDYQMYYQKYFSQRNLQKISANESRTQIGDGQLYGIIDAIKLCKNIQELELQFYVNLITDSGLFAITSLVNDHSKSLEILTINFEENQIRDRGILQLFQSINKCLLLRKLSLSFTKNRITDDGFRGLIPLANSSQIQLQELKLHFSENQITGNGLIDVLKALQQQKKLTSLSLYLADICINDQDFYGITEVLTNFKQLHELKLCFQRNDLSSDGFKGLAEIFKDNILLQSLEFYFQQNKIDDQGLISVVDKLQFCQKLQLVELFFSENRITDHGLIGTADSLRKCKQLKDIYIDFSENKIQEKQRIQQIFDGNFKGKMNFYSIDF